MKTLQLPKIHILLGEDDPDDSMLFIQALDETKLTSVVNIADNGAKFVDHVDGKSNSVPDIIFLDVNMPLKNGIECLQALRSKDDYKSVPVIMYSTSGTKGEIESCYEKGANYYVVKPFSFDAIKKMVSDFCTRDWRADVNRNLKNFVISFE